MVTNGDRGSEDGSYLASVYTRVSQKKIMTCVPAEDTSQMGHYKRLRAS